MSSASAARVYLAPSIRTVRIPDFSLMQIALVNTDTGRMQTIEAGWQERKDSYGDWFPHLFLFYTTNGYTDEGDNEGGYNQDVDGWVQYDGSVHPGAISSPNSTRGGDQYVMQIKYQLFGRATSGWAARAPEPSPFQGSRRRRASLRKDEFAH